MLFSEKHRWLITGVAVPYLVTRAALLLVGWFSQFFVTGPGYHCKLAYTEGWQYTSCRLLDIWGRFDTGWYFSIVMFGYSAPSDVTTAQSNVVFFPLYPLLVKLPMLLLPAGPPDNVPVLVCSVIISNALLIGALVLLYKVALSIFDDARAAEMTIWYLLLAPAGFVLSAAYTESTFLFFSLAAFLAALHRRWALACFFGMILSAARPLGGAIGLPILILYMESIRWRFRDIRFSILWLAIIPLGLLAFFTYMHFHVGDFWAPIRGQAAWEHEFLAPWRAFFDPTVCFNEKIQADRVVCLVALLLSIASFFTLRSRSFGVYALFLILVPLSGGTLDGASRYCLVIFPLFLQLVVLGRKYPWLDHTSRILMFTLQVLLFAAWCQFYRVI